MKNLDPLRKRLAALQVHIPQPRPWPPEEGSFEYCMWSELGRPCERMDYWTMYMAVSEKVWSEYGGLNESDYSPYRQS